MNKNLHLFLFLALAFLIFYLCKDKIESFGNFYDVPWKLNQDHDITKGSSVSKYEGKREPSPVIELERNDYSPFEGEESNELGLSGSGDMREIYSKLDEIDDRLNIFLGMVSSDSSGNIEHKKCSVEMCDCQNNESCNTILNNKLSSQDWTTNECHTLGDHSPEKEICDSLHNCITIQGEREKKMKWFNKGESACSDEWEACQSDTTTHGCKSIINAVRNSGDYVPVCGSDTKCNALKNCIDIQIPHLWERNNNCSDIQAPKLLEYYTTLTTMGATMENIKETIGDGGNRGITNQIAEIEAAVEVIKGIVELPSEFPESIEVVHTFINSDEDRALIQQQTNDMVAALASLEDRLHTSNLDTGEVLIQVNNMNLLLDNLNAMLLSAAIQADVDTFFDGPGWGDNSVGLIISNDGTDSVSDCIQNWTNNCQGDVGNWEWRNQRCGVNELFGAGQCLASCVPEDSGWLDNIRAGHGCFWEDENRGGEGRAWARNSFNSSTVDDVIEAAYCNSIKLDDGQETYNDKVNCDIAIEHPDAPWYESGATCTPKNTNTHVCYPLSEPRCPDQGIYHFMMLDKDLRIHNYDNTEYTICSSGPDQVSGIDSCGPGWNEHGCGGMTGDQIQATYGHGRFLSRRCQQGAEDEPQTPHSTPRPSEDPKAKPVNILYWDDLNENISDLTKSTNKEIKCMCDYDKYYVTREYEINDSEGNPTSEKIGQWGCFLKGDEFCATWHREVGRPNEPCGVNLQKVCLDGTCQDRPSPTPSPPPPPPAAPPPTDCTVTGLSAPDNGALDSACADGATLAKGETCELTCDPGYTLSGTQPSCSDFSAVVPAVGAEGSNNFNVGTITCTENTCIALSDDEITGYEVTNQGGTTVTELGQVNCASGYQGAAQAACPGGGGAFVLTGCVAAPPPPPTPAPTPSPPSPPCPQSCKTTCENWAAWAEHGDGMPPAAPQDSCLADYDCTTFFNENGC